MFEKDTIIGLAITAATLGFVLYSGSKPSEKAEKAPETAQKTVNLVANYGSPLVDGLGDDAAWQTTEWKPLDQLWQGKQPEPADFSGRYKLLWDESHLYILAEIVDDTLIDIHANGLEKYWDDDCLEIFIDEDASGGLHQYNYNAFAYHIALDGKVVDIASDKSFQYFNDHCLTRRKTVGNTSTWEVAMRVYDGKSYESGKENIARLLRKGKKMGFALAYCDNDRSPERESFMGSMPIEGEDKNRAWIDAGLFQVVELD